MDYNSYVHNDLQGVIETYGPGARAAVAQLVRNEVPANEVELLELEYDPTVKALKFKLAGIPHTLYYQVYVHSQELYRVIDGTITRITRPADLI